MLILQSISLFSVSAIAKNVLLLFLFWFPNFFPGALISALSGSRCLLITRTCFCFSDSVFACQFYAST